mmetsp:Transcript_5676/g.9405  ORF Transcript_5676/g.9405 Transcript_5676/m.9405 type:complete len:235 (+) Transcript_5676:140-844(+)|eukprot:CAMPEP_0119005116 /NCGR_PEP_ID=MMETSP1176-20130426/1536_1 /TAXON_ID=265551 /ORGANISM="Synedropsis recta cf, Strain CCMP1620" /LENGTH=234 /DNA_ID=CAMNT_0006956887 /DNA_START=129 /DNA_END=833 /DNA_ORIENTATION=-
MQSTEQHTDLESWREVHKTLTEAVIVGMEAVAAAKAQRRYWLEDICASLTAEGKLTPTAVWKKATKKGGPKRKAAKAVSKRKKSDDTETDEEVAPAKKAKAARKPKKTGPKKIKLKLKGPKPAVVQQVEDDEDEDMAVSTEPAYSMHEHEAAAALQAVSSAGDMSHIPEELRAFMAPQEYANSALEPQMTHMAHTTNPYAAKGLHPYDDDDDEEDDGDDDDDDDDDDDQDGYEH